MKYVDVIMLDIDGTMVGDVHYQVCQYEISNAVSDFSGKAQSNAKSFKRHLKEALVDGLLHPDLTTFLNNHKSSFRFFVYTAAETQWAIVLVNCMESVLGTKFQRPLFTRVDCIGNDLRKNIESVRQRIEWTIQTDKTSVRNIFMIDNNKTLNRQKRHLIHCPSYNRRVLTDVFEDLHEQIETFWYTTRDDFTLGEIIVDILIANDIMTTDHNRNSSFAEVCEIYARSFMKDHQSLRGDEVTNRSWSVIDTELENCSALTIAGIKNVNKEFKETGRSKLDINL